MNAQQPASYAPATAPAFPFNFSAEIQARLIALVVGDRTCSPLLFQWVKEEYLAPQHRWIWHTITSYRDAFGQPPTWAVIEHAARQANPGERDLLGHVVYALRTMQIEDSAWVRAQVMEWIKRCAFAASHKTQQLLFNAGKHVEAYDEGQKLASYLTDLSWKDPDRTFFFEDLGKREARRGQGTMSKIPTGIQELDAHLGGIGIGEGIIWIGAAKAGKSTILIQHGTAAVRGAWAPVLHFVLEGSRRLTEDRYEAAMTLELYSSVRAGRMDPVRYNQVFGEYQAQRRLLVIRALTERWDYSILDIDQEMRELREHSGWEPQMIVLDYIDLLHGRAGPYKAGWESERDACRDFKLLLNRGYAGATASQARRDAKNDDVEDLITSNDIAGSIEKVRAMDIIGSINATSEEKKQGRVRLYLELCRDAPGYTVIPTTIDQPRMRLGLAPVQSEAVGTPMGPTHTPNPKPPAPTKGKGKKPS